MFDRSVGTNWRLTFELCSVINYQKKKIIHILNTRKLYNFKKVTILLIILVNTMNDY